MLRLTPFTYIRPESVQHALILMADHGSEAALMGGGTDLLPNVKHRLTDPKHVIGLRSLAELQGITTDASGWTHTGAAETLSRVESSDLIRSRYPALADSASLVSSPQVRRQATIGGNVCLDVRCNYYNQSEHWRKAVGYCMKKDSEICRVAPGSDRCWAVSSADTVPVLIAYGAQIRIVGPAGERWEPIGGFYRDDGLVPMTLQPGEILAEIKLPPPDISVTYSKLRIRMSFDFPLVGVATGISLNADDTVREARIVLTAVSSHPVRVTEAESLLLGNRLDDDVIQAAGEKVFRTVHPMDNTEGSIPHRKRMARVYLERALRSVAGASPSGRR